MNNVRKLAPRFKRRLVTIIAGDVADFCRLMGADDEATLSQFLACRQILEDIVASGGGRMFGVAGDSWMAEFASPVEAVRCASACQRAIEAATVGCRKKSVFASASAFTWAMLSPTTAIFSAMK